MQIRLYDMSGAPAGETIITGDPAVIGGAYAYETQLDTSGLGSGVYVYAIHAQKTGDADLRASGKLAIMK